MEAHTGEAVVLQCAVSDGEVTHWLLNNELLQSSAAITTAGGTVTINSYQPNQHAGQYRCVAASSNTDTPYQQVSHFAVVSHMGEFLYKILTFCSTINLCSTICVLPFEDRKPVGVRTSHKKVIL